MTPMTSPRASLLALLLFLVPSGVVLPGCPICNSTSQVLDDFDRPCGDLPCSWEATTGTIASAPTFHESELGMRVGPSSVAERPVVYSPSLPPSALEVTARCDPGTILRISLEGRSVGDAGPTGDPVRGSLDVTDAAGKELFEIYRGTFGWPNGAAATTLRVETSGPGACVIDDIIVTSISTC